MKAMRPVPRGDTRAAGFTLLEMLVVLVIAGLLVSLASLTLTRNPRTDLNEEAQRRAPFPFDAARSRGFTMIEVLVALTIIAVALAASLRAVGSLATGEADLHRRLLAGWSADNTLAQLRLAHAWPEIGAHSFDCSQ